MKILCLFIVFLFLTVTSVPAQSLSPLEQLGKELFFDENLSTPPGQSCATCHAPEVGFTGPDSDINLLTAVYPGVISQRFGNRKPPSAAYGGGSPVLYYDELWIGGMFWDGRATGWTLGDPLAEQAMGPFLNPLEQNNPTAKLVCIKVAKSDYADLFEEAWGSGSLDFKNDVAGTYERIARSIAAYERSAEVNPYSSKFDKFWDGNDTWDGTGLDPIEKEGWDLFNGKGKCVLCHMPPDFTDFSYDNLGVPKNPDNPFYTISDEWNPDGADWIDPGLGGFLKADGSSEEEYMAEWGKHKVPTLRNVDLRPSVDFVKAYGHNGFFKSLDEIVHFYNTRDVGVWPAPEVPQNVNVDELGNLGLTIAEEAAIVAFMKTLSDGYFDPFAKPVVEAPVEAKHSTFLEIAGPNPFNPRTTLRYSLSENGRVKILVYNIMGQKVTTLVDGSQEAGSQTIVWDAGNLPSGTYFVRMESKNQMLTCKLLLVK